MRESPGGGGALLYLSRDASGRAVWARDVEAAEIHPTMREANRAALLAPAGAGAHRPAYAVPASVLRPEPEVAPVAPPVAASEAPPEDPAPAPAPAPARTGPWALWLLWVETWMGLLFRQERGARAPR